MTLGSISHSFRTLKVRVRKTGWTDRTDKTLGKASFLGC